MPQFLLSERDLENGRFRLSGPEAFHIVKVLRLKAGDEIRLFDGRGARFTGRIESVHADGTVEGSLSGTAPPSVAPGLSVRLYLGLLKSSHWEWALEKGTELGVSAFIPIITPRTVVRLKELGEAKKARWGKILLAAAKQSGRAKLPELLPPIHFRDAIREACAAGLTLMGWERGAALSTCPPLKHVLGESRPSAVNLFIGPEGGFSDEEVELAGLEGAKLFSLGPSTLRAETAAVAAAAILLHQLG